MSKQESLQTTRENVRKTISQFPQILENNPETWWRSSFRMIYGFGKELETNFEPRIRDYFKPQIDGLVEQLRVASNIKIEIPETENESEKLTKFAQITDQMIMDYSMKIAGAFEKKDIRIKSGFIPLEKMVENQPQRFKTEERLVNGEPCVMLQVKHPTEESWIEIPLPKKGGLWHKGGSARVVLDVVANAPPSMQKSEFPLHDYDVVVANGRNNKKTALNIGVDADGVESMGEDELNFGRYCAGRDTTQNQVCLGMEGLYYSKEAWKTATTGHTRIENEYVANKAIYGFDKITIQGESMAKPRGLMRLIKAVVEGKVLSFDHIPLNSKFDMGTNTLFLAKRWSSPSKKEKLPEYLQKMFFLLKQMGQVRENETNIFDTLERAHSENPYFDFDSEVRFPIQVVRWKAKKLVKQIDREMGWKFKIPTDMKIVRKPGDNIPQKISLEGFVFDQNQPDINDKWQEFLDRSRQRTKEYDSMELSAYEKTFKKGKSGKDGMMVEDDIDLVGDDEIDEN